MKKQINFSLREFCEVRSLQTIMALCEEMGLEFHWNLLSFSVNTDFHFLSLQKAFEDHDNVTILESDEDRLSKMRIIGFKTDMQHAFDKYVHSFISCAEVVSCRLYPRKHSDSDVKTIVLGNIKVKSPVEDFQLEIMQGLADMPFKVIVVPRHPLEKGDMSRLRIPEGLEFVNTMGELEALQARANLTIMGRIFSADGLKPDDDHNPIEATINSNTLCGVIKEVPREFRWLYSRSGLVHQCRTYDEVFRGISRFIDDPDLKHKLKRRDVWIKRNRERFLKKLIQTLDSQN